MEIPFRHDGGRGGVDVVVTRNDDPDLLASGAGGLGLPACTARVRFDRSGYRNMFGWVQLVRSTDNASAGAEFELDPFGPFTDGDAPYAFYGHLPTLFDAPSRSSRDDLDWVAHSFLAHTPLGERGRRVNAVLGFKWGFTITEETIEIHDPQVLSAGEWQEHLPSLAARFPTWTFPR